MLPRVTGAMRLRFIRIPGEGGMGRGAGLDRSIGGWE